MVVKNLANPEPLLGTIDSKHKPITDLLRVATVSTTVVLANQFPKILISDPILQCL